MALPLSILYMMRPVLAELAHAAAASRVLSLAYPDVLADRGQLTTLFGDTLRGPLAVRGDSARTMAFHGLGGLDHLVETESLFKALGLELDCIDIHAPRGVERIVDLNAPLPEDLLGRYRLVIDPGTIEHCFNIGQAMLNAARAMAVGGYIVHVNPLSMFNHGFYNLNPTFYYDFYGQNGFELLFMNGIAKAGGSAPFFDVAPVRRFGNVPEDSAMLVIAKRRDMRDIVWPVQSKYRSVAA